jgi:MFS family permease
MATMGSWRTAYFVVAAVAVAAGVTLWVLPIHVEQRERDVPAGPPHSSKLETSFNPKAKNIYGGLDRSVLIVLALLYGAMMFSGLNYRALMTSLPTYLTADEPGVYTGKGSSAIVLTVFVIGGIGQFLAGRFADRASAVRLYVALVATSVPMALLLAFSAGVGNLAAGAAMGLALVHFGTQPVENLLIAKHTPAHLRSMSYGFKFLLTFGVGALGAPMVGALWDATGTFAWTYVIFAAVAVIVTAIVMVLVKVIARHDEPEPAVDLPPTPPVAEQA